MTFIPSEESIQFGKIAKGFMEENQKLQAELTQLKAENEKLLRLLEDVHRKQYELDAIIANWSPNQLKQMQDKEWQQFKTQNSI